MILRTQGLCAIAAALLATSTFAQTSFPEVEPNSVKAEATPVTGIVAGDSITGTSTGTVTTVASTLITTVDTFRVRTAALPVGIYKHTLTISSAVAGHTGTIRGLNQTGTAGTASTGGTPGTVDTAVQTSSTTSVNPPPRSNVWYGFGKQEELYYRVTGGAATTAAYASTLATAPITATVIAPSFESSSPVTISSVGQTTADTDIHVYDSNLNALPGFDNDDEGPAGLTLQSRLTRTYAPGTYFVAIGRFQTAWNFPAPPDEDFPTGTLMDFPDSLVNSSLTPTTGVDDRDFVISACNGTFFQANQVASPDSYSIQWFQFTVALGAPVISVPANDNCASAISFGATTSHTTKLSTATNDGVASCDPGGAASKDVWYSFNGGSGGGSLSVNTCGTTLDTVVSVYNSCGGTELACNDNCGGAPCASSASCLSGILLAANQVVLVRVSDKGLGGCGDVTTSFTYVPMPPSNDDCNTPIVLPGPGVYPFDTTAATTGTQGQGLTPACRTTGSVKKDIWYTYTAAVSGNVTFSTCGTMVGATTDSKISYFSGAGCPAAASPIGCNDDAGAACPAQGLNTILTFAVTCGQVFAIQVGNFSTAGNSNGTFSVVESGTGCSTPSTSLCLGDGTGAPCPCGNNATTPGNGCATTLSPGGARLSSSGVASDETVSGPNADTLVLTGTGLTGPALFFQADAAPGVINFGDGHLCASSNIQRMGVVFPAAGVASYPGGTTPFEIHTFGNDAGETKFYQCWYRSSPALCNPGVQNFSLTQALSLTWTN